MEKGNRHSRLGKKNHRIGPHKGGEFRFSLWYFLAALVVLLLVNIFIEKPRFEQIEYSKFKKLVQNGTIQRVEIREQYYIGFPFNREDLSTIDEYNKSGQIKIYKTVPIEDPQFIPLLESKNVEYYGVSEKKNPLLDFLLYWVLPTIFFIFIWRMVLNKMGTLGPNVMSFGKNNYRIVGEGEVDTGFKDVAGNEVVKEEVIEVVEFLKSPEKFNRIGGKIPKGILLVGPPGTGKTLLARAVAGEAGVPFFKMSGADFVEMFVGVGAARVRDLFKQAREKAPCIIFIDELDAIGKSRVHGFGGNDEREQTLNQLLVEMDGFDSRTGVIILAATNRPEILDPALLRPGRFDRQVIVEKPDIQEREAILKIHAKDVKINPRVDLRKLAALTPGLVGADLANIVNEAALIAVRNNRETVWPEDFEEAIEKIMAGLKKKNKIISENERKRVAVHEIGHALTAYCTATAEPVEKISIIPRGFGSLGFTLQLPTEERYVITQEELFAKIDVLLGGRAAEEVFFHDLSSGAANDLTKATDIAKKMITEYGMSEKFKNVYLPFESKHHDKKQYSEATQQYIDEETARIMKERYMIVLGIIQENRDLLEILSEKLLQKETIDKNEFERIVSARRKSV